MLKKQKFGGILCDLGSRRAEAMNLLTEVGKDSPKVAFVMITKRRDVRLGMLALIAGASGYLLKPLESNAILGVASGAPDQKTPRSSPDEASQQGTRTLVIYLVTKSRSERRSLYPFLGSFIPAIFCCIPFKVEMQIDDFAL